MSGGGLFDNVGDEDDQLFNDLDPKPSNRETTPDFFNEVKPSDSMNLFSPSKPKDALFDFDDDNDTVNGQQQQQEDDDISDLDDEVKPKKDVSEEPLGFLNEEENDTEIREDFELIDSTEVPSVEEAERQLEIVRQESERVKREEEEQRRLEEEEEEEREENKEEKGEESHDGGAFSRVFGGDPNTEDHRLIAHDVEGSNENNDKILEELQQEVSQLTNTLRSAQAENGGLNSEVSELRIQLTEEREKNDKLQEELKKKDAEIASLKEALAAASGGGKPPKPSTRKPSMPPSTTKATAVSSPRTTSARLKQDSEKKSVAETAKRFNQPADKKTSPSLRRPSASTTVKSPDTRTVRKSSADSHPVSPDKKSSSPPKPVRSRARADSKDDSPMISHKPQRNTLDAIKLWEQKSGDKKESSPATVKKPLSNASSSPHIGDDTTKENGEENLPPTTTTDDDGDVVDTKEKIAEQQKSPLRTGNVSGGAARQRKTESMIVSGTKSSRWSAPTTDKCQVCKKSVYPMERLIADEKAYHKTCFRCSHCKKVIGLGTYAANKGELFCKTHFKMLFKIKGNYDEGFGREQHKKRWAKGGTPNNEQEQTTTADAD